MKIDKYKSMKDLFRSFGYEIIDIQEDDFSVGIFDGWVIFEMISTGLQYEMSWSNAQYCRTQNDIENESAIYTEN